jgi:4-hydroxybenzoyl-CoA reductase subunit beta
VRVGAGVTLTTLADHAQLAAHYRAINEAAAAIAGPAHRTIGTVGGNLCLDTRCIFFNQSEWWRRANGYCLKHKGDICHVAPQGQHCHAAYTGDLAPALLVHGAEVEIAGPDGSRQIPLADLYTEDGRNHLALGDELVLAVRLPPSRTPSSYAKVRPRGAIDYPLAGVAVALSTSGGVLSALRIGLTGTNSRPFLLTGTDAFLGRSVDAHTLREIDRLVQRQVQPMRTTIASAQYRRLAAAGLARRLMTELTSSPNS